MISNLSVSKMFSVICDTNCDAFTCDLVSCDSDKFIFYLGYISDICGFIPIYKTRPISFKSRSYLVSVCRTCRKIGYNGFFNNML